MNSNSASSTPTSFVHSARVGKRIHQGHNSTGGGGAKGRGGERDLIKGRKMTVTRPMGAMGVEKKGGWGAAESWVGGEGLSWK